MMAPPYHPRRLLLDAPMPHPPTTLNQTSSFCTADIKSNMKIMLVALLSALLCGLGLNSIIRCFLRYGHVFASESNREQHPVSVAAAGLKKDALSQIPVAAYGSGASLATTDCSVCLGEFVEREKVRVLPKCNHGFHVKCIDTWFLSSSSCPLCRQPFLDKPIIHNVEEEVHISFQLAASHLLPW